jgi:hypothetical protein
MITDLERYEQYVAWTKSIGIPTRLPFDGWLKQDAESPTPRKGKEQRLAEMFLISVGVDINDYR